MASKPPAPGKVPDKTYDWGDGKGSKHSISLKSHNTHVQAKALAPYDIGGGYDPAQVRTSVNSAMDTEYGQPILTQQQEITDSQHRQNVDIPAWYQQYIDALNQSRTQAATAYASGAQPPTTAVPNTGDPTADMASENRIALQNSFAGLMKDQGANTDAYYGAAIPNASLMQAGALQQQGVNTQNLQGQLGQLQKERGEYGNTYLQDMREKAQTFQANEDAATAAAAASGAKLDFDKQKLDYNNNGVPDNIEAAQTKNDNQITKWGYTNAEWRNMSTSDRDSIIAAQKPPATPKENTKDYYGHTWEGNGKDDKGWKNMTYSERRKAQQGFKTPAKKAGPSTGQRQTAQAGFKFALDWFRKNTNKGSYTDPDTHKPSNDATQVMLKYASVDGVKVDYQIAQIMQHWAKNNGRISADEYKTLTNAGIPEKWLQGHLSVSTTPTAKGQP